jgi:DNA replication protein DnaC
MTKEKTKVEQFIYKEVNGELTAYLNPDWKEMIQNEKFSYFLNKSNIPNDYWDLDFDSFPWEKSKPQVDNCRKYALECKEEKFKDVSLYLYGGNSSGKTTVACSIAKEFIRKGLRVKFILAGSLAEMLMKKSSYTTDEEIKDKIEDLKNSDLVIIDDCFDRTKSIMWKSDSKNLIISVWDSFLRDILSRQVRVIITSNILPLEIQNIYGKSMYELIDRNFVLQKFEDSVKYVKKDKFKNIFN